jgi:hypothetical protein
MKSSSFLDDKKCNKINNLPFSGISCEVSKLLHKLSSHLNSHLHHSISERNESKGYIVGYNA